VHIDLSFNATLVAVALAIEAALGYPEKLFRAIRHPVVWIGALISGLDRVLNRPQLSAPRRRAAGVVALALLVIVAAGPAGFLQHVLGGNRIGLLLLAMVGSWLPAQRSLFRHVRAVADALEGEGLPAGRRAVAQIVGRDPDCLDEPAVARAAIESLAENFSDGLVAPALWGVLLGLPGMVGYKAINTADSMIGHRTERHGAFGWAAARLDDLVNLPASRLSALWLVLAACIQPGADPGGAVRAIRRDASRHRSPNAGWPEAAMAGALGLRLAGPRRYAGRAVEDAWMGDGRADVTVADLHEALALYRLACGINLAAILLLAIAFTGPG
jgi:adenosylcobinamide-phosphate synthase